MGAFLPVNEYFRAVYLVDLSPSLCDIAKARFARLGWNNVHVICQDARYFSLEQHELSASEASSVIPKRKDSYNSNNAEVRAGADLLTMSYALSMIPEFYPVVDSLSTLLHANGVIGVIDFYVQSQVDYRNRNYTGGIIDRHCSFWSRTFWRSWFDVDRVSLEGARRDYLEYRFGTRLSVNARNHILGVRIPYYIWVGCSKNTSSMREKIDRVDAAVTESPFIAALDLNAQTTLRRSESFEARSKAYESAVINLAGKLPLPCFWYQNHHWRIYYDEKLAKHTQFKDEYIYAFTWEDSRVDSRILKINPDDVILAITSAGDNILHYAVDRPKRIHAVDLKLVSAQSLHLKMLTSNSPTQNHLLELKLAAFTALPYSEVWALFGEGRHPNFRGILINKLSVHMSSQSFQYWLSNGEAVFGKQGLYYTGGSRHALILIRRLFKILNLESEVNRMCEAQTLNEQKEIWQRSIRKVLLSRLLSWTVVSSEKWLWKALGVPKQQRDVIEVDYQKQADAGKEVSAYSKQYGHAIWEYVVNTLDPVVNHTLMREDNHYYLLCLQGKYSRRSHPEYLKPTAFAKLSTPGAFESLRIHTDEINEVVARLSPGTLTIAVVMDSMDWFDPEGEEAGRQIIALNKALAMKGRVLLRSAGLEPWYLKKFAENGFSNKAVGQRVPGTCIDRSVSSPVLLIV
jgi:betaine lipid synthase